MEDGQAKATKEVTKAKLFDQHLQDPGPGITRRAPHIRVGLIPFLV